MLCVTLGADGAMLLVGDELIAEPAVRDHGGRHHRGRRRVPGRVHLRLLNQYPPREMLRFANAAAAVSCTRAGAMAGVPTLAEVEQMMR